MMRNINQAIVSGKLVRYNVGMDGNYILFDINSNGSIIPVVYSGPSVELILPALAEAKKNNKEIRAIGPISIKKWTDRLGKKHSGLMLHAEHVDLNT